MLLPLKIALRYLLSKKKHNAVNIISWVSLAAIAVATAATVIVLSVFNGFSSLAEKQLSFLSPPLMVTKEKGRVISDADSIVSVLEAHGFRAMESIETQGIGVSAGSRFALRIIGMPEDFPAVSRLDSVIIDGEAVISVSPCNLAVASVGSAIGLQTRPSSYRFTALYTPRRHGSITNGIGAFRTDSVVIAGVYQVNQDEFDADVILVPSAVARHLASLSEKEATSVWVYAPESAAPQIREMLGDSYNVATRIQQQISNFKMISVEKWITFTMLAFILVIASFNIISTLAILIIEKEPNMEILRAMGATRGFINRIFMLQGWLITLAGGMIGIVTGLALSLLQQHFGLIRLSAEDPSALLITTYPVVVRFSDILLVAVSVIAVAAFTSLTAKR